MGCLALHAAVLPAATDSKNAVRYYKPVVVEEFAHNRSFYTQGFTFDNGYIIEGTGLNGQSLLVKYSLGTQRVAKMLPLEPRYFGEGVDLLGDRIYQLTWQAGIGWVYDSKTWQKLGEFHYQGEGWGLTHAGRQLVMSNGSDTLSFIDPAGFVVERKLPVTLNGIPQFRLNELEYIDGLIYANVWQSNEILQIRPDNGRVVGVADLSSIAERYRGDNGVDVLNGIAWDAAGQRLLVTGKRWPHIYHIRLEAVEPVQPAK